MAERDELDLVLMDPRLTDQDWEEFAKILKLKNLFDYVPQKRREIVNQEIRHCYGHTIKNVTRDPFSPDYIELLIGVAKKLKIEFPAEDVETIEKQILLEFIRKIKEKIIKKEGPEAWEDVVKRAQESFEELYKAGKISQEELNEYKQFRGGAIGAAILAGRMKGFGLFMFANQLFFAVARNVGVKVGVAAAGPIIGKGLAFVLGPVGWGIAGGMLAFDLGNTNWGKVIPSIFLTISLRYRFAYEPPRLTD